MKLRFPLRAYKTLDPLYLSLRQEDDQKEEEPGADAGFKSAARAGHTKNRIIEGLTSVGRVTILRLRMNRDAQVSARLQWMTIGIFSLDT
jgi:hypothetical protein